MNRYIECPGPFPDERMVKFIMEHHVMTLATVSQNAIPWCASCFYAYDPGTASLVFTSDETTRHGLEMTGNPLVSAAIALETRITGRIRGVQISGKVRKILGEESGNWSSLYLKNFPVAALVKTTLWVLECEYINPN
ncbi:MAG TPA: pyridoxamine 5'-phosphate oxidase family protein [Bacteroidales bacterium]|nr:pyridoxamine 5'-phosphate oxidase family protein [Bacteroidales bacterium]